MTDLWDRRLNAVYLAGMLQSTVVDGAEVGKSDYLHMPWIKQRKKSVANFRLTN